MEIYTGTSYSKFLARMFWRKQTRYAYISSNCVVLVEFGNVERVRWSLDIKCALGHVTLPVQVYSRFWRCPLRVLVRQLDHLCPHGIAGNSFS